MIKKKLTLQEILDENYRLLHLFFYSKSSDEEKQVILKNIEINLKAWAELKAYKFEIKEQKRAEREAFKLGVKKIRESRRNYRWKKLVLL